MTKLLEIPPDPTKSDSASADQETLQRAYNYLGRCIGHESDRVDMSKLEIIFADTLATLEKLTDNVAMDNEPKATGPAEMLKKIGRLVPRGCIDTQQIETIRETEGIVVAKAVKVIALGNYIRRLQNEKDGVTSTWQFQTTIRTKPVERQPVDIPTVLEKMENWCDAWLRGDLKDDDWNRFEDCLSR